MERVLSAITGMVRTLKVATEKAFKMDLDPRSPVLQWLVQLAGFVLSRFEVRNWSRREDTGRKS
eukprot:3787805-Prorocentrum_lima.AAC.1